MYKHIVIVKYLEVYFTGNNSYHNGMVYLLENAIRISGQIKILSHFFQWFSF